MQSSSLVLAHSDISPNFADDTATHANGSYWTARRATATWKINMRTLVGPEIWDTHKGAYILRLNSFSHNGADFTTNPNNQSLRVQLDGLAWKNSSYDTRTAQNTTKYDAFCLYMEENISRSYYLSPNISKAQFVKSSDMVDLTVSFIRMVDGLPVTVDGANPMPMCVLTFDVFPVIE